nr:MAG TPA: hypothetical protein [Caudoviricetes sp.]
MVSHPRAVSVLPARGWASHPWRTDNLTDSLF